MGRCPVGKWIIFQVPVLLWNSAHFYWIFQHLASSILLSLWVSKFRWQRRFPKHDAVTTIPHCARNAFSVLQPSVMLWPLEGHFSAAFHAWKTSQTVVSHFTTILWRISSVSLIFGLDWYFPRIFSWKSALFSLLEMLQRCSQIHVCLLWHHVKHFNNTEVRRLAVLSISHNSMTFDPELFICWTGIKCEDFLHLLPWLSICDTSFSSRTLDLRVKQQKLKVQDLILS